MTDAVKTDEVRIDEAKLDVVKVDEAKADAVKTDEARVNEAKTDAVKSDKATTDLVPETSGTSPQTEVKHSATQSLADWSAEFLTSTEATETKSGKKSVLRSGIEPPKPRPASKKKSTSKKPTVKKKPESQTPVASPEKKEGEEGDLFAVSENALARKAAESIQEVQPEDQTPLQTAQETSGALHLNPEAHLGRVEPTVESTMGSKKAVDMDKAPPDPNARYSKGSAYFDAGIREYEHAHRTFLVRLGDWMRSVRLRFLKRMEERSARTRLGSIGGQADEKRRQRMNLVISIVTVLLASTVALYVIGDKHSSKVSETQPKRTDFRIAPDAIERQSFQRQYEERLDKVTDDVKALTATLEQLNGRLKEKVGGKGSRKKPSGAPESAEDPYRSPAHEFEEVARAATLRASEGRLGRLTLSVPVKDGSDTAAPSAVVSTPSKPTSVLGWDEPLSRNRAEGAGIYLPAGTFAKTVVLSGVTAPTGGTASHSPIPMLLEVTDYAHLPNSFRSQIRRCFVTANATGDLSSERVWVRLERLSCMRRSGEAVDVRIQGYATGEDGKTGARARLVTRSGQAIANALFLGAVSGLGKAVSLSAQSTTTHASGTVTQTVEDPWRAGLGEGIEDATNRIVSYYIKLADKIFPVLELDSGRRLDIVLSQGVRVGPGVKEGGHTDTFELKPVADMVPSNSAQAFGHELRRR